MQTERGPLTEEEQDAATAEMRDIERWFEERETDGHGEEAAAA
ncbi:MULTISPECIES: hypothetical protein [Streptomyces]